MFLPPRERLKKYIFLTPREGKEILLYTTPLHVALLHLYLQAWLGSLAPDVAGVVLHSPLLSGEPRSGEVVHPCCNDAELLQATMSTAPMHSCSTCSTSMGAVLQLHNACGPQSFLAVLWFSQVCVC
jgi:hypothetical protein